MTEFVAREDEPAGDGEQPRARARGVSPDFDVDGKQARVLLQNLLAGAADRIYFKDRDSRIMLVSDYLAEALGYETAAEVIGKCDGDHYADEIAVGSRAVELRVMESGQPYSALERVVAKDGAVTWLSTKKMPLIDEDGQVIGIFGIGRNVTKQIEAEEVLAQRAEELKLLALRDELTGLHNRRAFLTLGALQLEAAKSERRPFAVLFVDLDHFKDINDTLGHREGDRALVDTGGLLQSTFRDSDIVARFGGDEFCVLIEGRESDARAAVRRFLKAVAAHNDSRARRYTIEPSVGVALFDPETPRSLEQLVRAADQQMYKDKLARRGTANDPAPAGSQAGGA